MALPGPHKKETRGGEDAAIQRAEGAQGNTQGHQPGKGAKAPHPEWLGECFIIYFLIVDNTKFKQGQENSSFFL